MYRMSYVIVTNTFTIVSWFNIYYIIIFAVRRFPLYVYIRTYYIYKLLVNNF